jgi:hypothetical protein
MKDYFKTPSPEELAAKELDEARRELLKALSGQDYANRIVQYHEDRIKRLTEYLNG